MLLQTVYFVQYNLELDMSIVMDDLVEVQDDSNHCTPLLILPTELLVMILSYLSIRDIISMQLVSKRFKNISETLSLWKKFVWPDYEPHHVFSVSKVLKTHGEHVRQMFFPAHVTPVNILEMTHYCPKVTHLSLPRKTQLSLDHLKEIVHTMTHLEQLDVFTSSIKCDCPSSREDVIKQLLEITTACVKKLVMKIDVSYYHSTRTVLKALKNLLENDDHPLPSVINILMYEDDIVYSNLWEYCLASSYTIASLEIGLYDIARVPMDLYPSIPLRKFQFGPAAKSPPLIIVRLSDHGILGLDKDIFYSSDYDHYGKAWLSVSPKYDFHLVDDEHLHCISNFNSVSNVDFSGVNIYPDHLEQLAIACPNLERLNLSSAQNSLQNLQGLRTIVATCQNLQGLNLVGIPASSVESYLMLWELLSSIKYLTHLAIDLCMLIHINNKCYNVADKDKLIGMLENCESLKALEITQELCHPGVYDLLFSHFPSLVYVRLFRVQCITAFEYTITNCCRLKYLYYYRADLYVDSEAHVTLPSSSNCRLQQLCIESCTIDLSAPSVQVLSTHGGLEQVVLFVKSITTSAITTLISNSPYLKLLYIVTMKTLHDDNGVSVNQEDYKDTVSKRFSYHKLLTTGDLILTTHHYSSCNKILTLFNTNLKSFWRPV